MPGALVGIKVLEVTQIIAGPFAGVLLSDMGADVVKIEPPTGDGMRLLGQFAPNESKGFHAFNRGKRGMVVNLASDEGQAIVHRMISDFDVFLINARPGVPERIGVDYDTLSALNPGLIYLENTAYGPDGPSAHRAGADIIAQAYSGLMAGDEKVDEHGGPDLITATTPADFSAAWISAMAVCAALYHRERTGDGQKIDTSLLGGALTLQNAFVMRLPAVDAVIQQPILDRLNEIRSRGGSYREMVGARGGLRSLVGGAFMLYYGGYETSDGAIMLGCVSPANRQQVREAIGLAEDPTSAPDFNPFDEGSEEIVAKVRSEIAALFKSQSTEHWVARLDEVGAPASQVNFGEEILDDPQVQALGIISALDHPMTGPEEAIGPAFRMSATPTEASGPSPMLDADTDEVLAQYGYSAEEIAALRASGAAGVPSDG
ncbi:MAG: CoA transferase [Chloroflexi bacterium]|nr:CoA transferase [Chloroflexota bacterium]MYF81238.1 CoA transferase [Chloroflexota bacterium]MYI03697.1 CoA transferase [Chloroflexota bacterium]